MLELSLAIVGIPYPNKKGPARRFETELCRSGEPVELRLDPKNKKDPHAVAVYSCRDVQLGFLTAERAPWIGGMIRQGREITAVFQGLAGNVAWVRVAFDGAEPTLPEQSESSAGEEPGADGFWPDEVWEE